jgi:hypothetical protein
MRKQVLQVFHPKRDVPLKSIAYAQKVMQVGPMLRTFIALSGSRESSMTAPKLEEER